MGVLYYQSSDLQPKFSRRFCRLMKCDHFDPQRSLRKGTMNGAGGVYIYII